MNSIKKYKVTATWFNDAQLELQVDHDVLTPGLAAMINSFWSGDDSRLASENDDPVRAVIRDFGSAAIRHFMGDGGADFRSEDAARRATQSVIDAQGEGWPDVEELGILILSASVFVVSFDDVELEAA